MNMLILFAPPAFAAALIATLPFAPPFTAPFFAAAACCLAISGIAAGGLADAGVGG